MDPKHLYYLSVIMDKGSMTEAAHALAVTQPTLTRVVSTLEMQAGTKIFHRSRHGVKATPLGEALAREGRSIHRCAEAAMQLASRYRIGLDREIRIGVGPLLAATYFPEIVARLIERFPESSLTIETARPVALYNGLLEDKYDIVIAPSAVTKDPPGYIRELVSEDQLAIYCSERHPYAKLKSVSVEDLRRAYWLSLGHASPFERDVMDMFSVQGVSRIRTQAVFGNDSQVLLHLLSKGKHLCVLPRLPLKFYRGDTQMVELEVETRISGRRDIFAFTKDNHADNPFFKALLDELRATSEALSD